MILGIGNDIVEIARIEKAIQNESFKKRVYTLAEIELIEKKELEKLLVMQEDFQLRRLYQRLWVLV